MSELKSFKKWSELGYKIIRGSKATWINDTPMFSENQVVKYKRYNSYNGRISRCDFAMGLDHDECVDFPYDGDVF